MGSQKGGRIAVTQRTALEQCLNIVLSDDKCIAYLEFSKEEEGFACTIDELEQFVANKGIKQGVLREALLLFVSNPETYLKDKYKIAEGIDSSKFWLGWTIQTNDDRLNRKMEPSITKK